MVCQGRVRVSLDPGDVELAVLERGAYFGEMSLLTGDPRTASVRALGDCTVVEITSDAFRAFVLNQPALVERIGAVIAERRAGHCARSGDGRQCPAARVGLEPGGEGEEILPPVVQSAKCASVQTKCEALGHPAGYTPASSLCISHFALSISSAHHGHRHPPLLPPRP